MFNHFLFLSILGLSSLQISSAAPRYKRSVGGPVITTDFPDPAVINVGGTWYAFGTQSVYDYTNIKVQVATSTDFNTWTVTGNDALGSLPSWVVATSSTSMNVWAPQVIQLSDGTFLMYYSATTNTAGDGAYHCIGTATSSSVEGPYQPTSDDPWTCPTDQGGAIDPSGFQDTDGTRYVVYKIDANSKGNGGNCNNGNPPIVSTPIMIQQVEDDGITPVGDAQELIDNGEADGPDVEAPSMFRASDGTYILFFSSNCYSGSLYDVSYATSSSPTGGFVKGGPLFVTGTDGLIGPGGADIDVDGTHMVFHGYASESDVGGRRSMYTATISSSGDTVSA